MTFAHDSQPTITRTPTPRKRRRTSRLGTHRSKLQSRRLFFESLEERRVLAAVVYGDQDTPNQDDDFLVNVNSENSNLIDVTRNGTFLGSVDHTVVEGLVIYGLGGNDRLRVDSTNGLV